MATTADEQFTTPEVARRLGLSESRIRQLEIAGTIPPARRLSSRFRMYDEHEIELLRDIIETRRSQRRQTATA